LTRATAEQERNYGKALENEKAVKTSVKETTGGETSISCTERVVLKKERKKKGREKISTKKRTEGGGRRADTKEDTLNHGTE